MDEPLLGTAQASQMKAEVAGLAVEEIQFLEEHQAVVGHLLVVSDQEEVENHNFAEEQLAVGGP